MNNTFLAIGDVHFDKSPYMLNEPALNMDLFEAFMQAVYKAIELKVKYFITLGDISDTTKPPADTITFLVKEKQRLERAGITWLGLEGDHDRQVGNHSWLHDVVGVHHIDTEPSFIGMDYNIDPAVVKNGIEAQLKDRGDKVEFIFFHAQVPELFGFTEEKKLLDLDWEFICKHYPNIKGFVGGDIHSGPSKRLSGGQFLGYTGALGVTKLDEVTDKKYLYWDGKELTHVPHDLVRIFHDFNLTEESLKEIEKDKKAFVDKEIKEIKESFDKTGKKPVYLVRYQKALFGKLTELAFLSDHAILRTTLLSEDKKEIVNVNIRSEIKNTENLTEVFKATLVESNTYNEEIYQLGVSLLDSLVINNTKDILNKAKETYL